MMTTIRENREMLDAIWRGEISPERAVIELKALLHCDDYLLRSRVYALLEKTLGEKLLSPLLDAVYGEEEREWQLRALAVLAARGDVSLLPKLRPLLFQLEQPLLLRGSLRVICAWGGREIQQTLAEFIESPYAGILKSDYLTDCVVSAVRADGETHAHWLQVLQSHPAAARWYATVAPNREPNELLMVYPHPDYLVHMARERNIAAKDLRRALYFPHRQYNIAMQSATESPILNSEE